MGNSAATITLADIIKTMVASVVVGAITLYGTVRVLEAKIDAIEARANAALQLATEVSMRQATAIAERKTTDSHHSEMLRRIDTRLDNIEIQHNRTIRR